MSLKTQIKTPEIQKFQVKIEWKTLINSPKKRKTKSVSTWKDIIQIQVKAKYFTCIILAELLKGYQGCRGKFIPICFQWGNKIEGKCFQEAKRKENVWKATLQKKCFLI